MSFLPLMPGQSPMTGPASAPGAPVPPPSGVPEGSDLMSLLGGQPSPQASAMPAALSTAMRQFDQVQQIVMDLTRMFPGNEDSARAIMEALGRWRQGLVVGLSQPSQQMPGAPML